jgi:hypothetical protein
VDIYAHLGVRRSFKREVITQALIAVLMDLIFDANNPWRKVERAKGKMQSQSIQDRYVEVLKVLRQQLNGVLYSNDKESKNTSLCDFSSQLFS